jgi:hypothetical protein
MEKSVECALHILYAHSSPYIIRVVRSRRMRWAGACITYRRDGEIHTKFLSENLKEETA